MELNLTKPLCFFDLETTGVILATDRIVEICIHKVNPDASSQTLTRRVNPLMPIPKEASSIHHIYDEDVKDCPTFKDIAGELNAFIGHSDLAGYNSNRFDIPLLVEEFLRAGVDFEIKHRRLIDIQNIFHKMEQRTLSAAYRFYCSKSLESAHSAEADTLATYEILKAQLDRYQDIPYVDPRSGTEHFSVVNDMDVLAEFTTVQKTVDLAGVIVFNAKGVEVFNIGKYKSRPVREVLQHDPSYYDWMMKADFPLYTKKVLTAIRLSMR